MPVPKILEKYHFPYLSIDYLKMGLIRSGYTNLTPGDDGKEKTYLRLTFEFVLSVNRIVYFVEVSFLSSTTS